jgi:putative salt-induced outer membrane protein YdiY
MKYAAVVLVCAAAWCQTPVAPTDEPVGPRRGTDRNTYNVENSIETGYRFRLVSGNLGKYRSDVNYGNGVRLLSGFLAARSRDGAGKYFDEVVLSTLGLGNDPYQNATFRIQKNRIYRYDLLWRLNEYYNPALTLSLGQHFLNTSRRMQDHDFTLFPDSSFRIFMGYSRNMQTGPALSTIQLFDSRGDEFPLFADIRRVRNEVRFGNELRVAGWRLNWMRAWANFSEDVPARLRAPSAGNNPEDTTGLTAFERTEPYRGNSPFWRVALFKEDGKRMAVNGRFTYTAGQRTFVLDETAVGTARFGSAFNRQILTYGNGRRPVATGNLNLTGYAGPRVTVTNHTALYNVRAEGDSYYRSVDNGSFTVDLVNFQYLGIRTFSNQTDVDFAVRPSFGISGGYGYSNRAIRSMQQVEVAGVPVGETATQTNHLNSGTLGIRWRPVSPLMVIVSGEVGRANRPIFPTSERNYEAFGARVQYRTRTLRFAAFGRTNYNNNSVSMSAFSSRSRQYAGELSWAPQGRVSLDASYSKLHLDTEGGISYFLDSTLITGERSYYFSNIHHANVMVRFAVAARVDLFMGYSRVQDRGDGRATAVGPRIGSAVPLFQAAQTFPMTFESPLARLSIRFSERLRWNAGFQYYRYSEVFSILQDYRARTGFVSLSWSL